MGTRRQRPARPRAQANPGPSETRAEFTGRSKAPAWRRHGGSPPPPRATFSAAAPRVRARSEPPRPGRAPLGRARDGRAQPGGHHRRRPSTARSETGGGSRRLNGVPGARSWGGREGRDRLPGGHQQLARVGRARAIQGANQGRKGRRAVRDGGLLRGEQGRARGGPRSWSRPHTTRRGVRALEHAGKARRRRRGGDGKPRGAHWIARSSLAEKPLAQTSPPRPPSPCPGPSSPTRRAEKCRGRERGEERRRRCSEPPLSGPAPSAACSQKGTGRARERGVGG